MADDTVRILIAFEGGQSLSSTIAASTADALETALLAGTQAVHRLDTDEGRTSIVLGKVLYLTRYARDSRVGFGL